ncbi:enoyl-CoA hydratase-related protein [Nocardioides lijunqiniae]|uniref:enoyl-CoA hydratase-related protein n=1 Tax=Nocardioides lijunqiniae TaxID=2760832 RepID=UPI0018777319|nr:enoyl-CoA hydratase-related protein [Nocardioides lijunqiniae]
MKVQQNGPIWILDLGDDENTLSPTILNTLEATMEDVVASNEPAALMTVGSGKLYSNGLDLDWLGENPSEFDAYLARVQTMLARLLTLPVPTVAAISGHAFGAGAMLALAHDYRVMRTERGYFCLPEIDLHVPFTDGLARLVTAKLGTLTAFDLMTTGRRYDAESAEDAGITNGTAPIETLVTAAASHVEYLADKDRVTMSAIKKSIFTVAYDALGGHSD